MVAQAPTWDARVQRLRQVPEVFGLAQQARVYGAIAEQVYRPELSPMFAHLPWRQEYELGPFAETYHEVHEQTGGFAKVEDADIRDVLLQSPRSLRVFRMLLGYTADELAAAVTILLSERGSTQRVGKGRVLGMERGQKPTTELAAAIARTIN
jgi:hypothetical protein